MGAAGCFLGGEEETLDSGDQVVGGGDTSAVLRSTIVLDTGCTAAKVGPRHLLTAARCVVGKPELAPGKTFTFKAASQLRTIVAEDDEPALEAEDANDEADEADEETGEGATDGGADEADEADAAAPKKTNTSDREATIEEIEVHPSFTAKCQDELCDFGAIGASDAKDIAVILLDADLESVPTIPIDLDAFGQSDAVLAVGSGCATFDGEATGVKTYKTIAVPAKSVNHVGSPYIEDPALVTRLAAGYVVTPGFGWRAGEPRVCATDIGAPLFRGGQAAVAGVTSNFTTFGLADEIAPVTLHHTKVDATSKVGTWLASLGVETTRSCSELPGGCVKKEYDGGEDEEADAGPISTDLPEQGEEATLPEQSDDEYYPREGSGEYDDWDAGPKKKKKKKASGCSAAPGSTPSGSDGIVFVVGLALAGAVARRRRAE
ncbi:MAG: hypothetical protein KIS78_28730 [Labilithrix sp.]|nr:hypothetical protein [Labilithrix sp.]